MRRPRHREHTALPEVVGPIVVVAIERVPVPLHLSHVLVAPTGAAGFGVGDIGDAVSWGVLVFVSNPALRGDASGLPGLGDRGGITVSAPPLG
jgi:hypothetical protein